MSGGFGGFGWVLVGFGGVVGFGVLGFVLLAFGFGRWALGFWV